MRVPAHTGSGSGSEFLPSGAGQGSVVLNIRNDFDAIAASVANL